MWDERIDEIARQMTAADAPPDLRARVRTRIDNAGSRRSRRAAWLLSPFAIAMAIVVALLLRGSQQSSHEPASAARQDVARIPPDTMKGPAADATPASPGIVRPPERGRARVQVPAGSAAAGALGPLQLAPLDVEPMQLQAIDKPEIARPETIGVSPLTVAPLASQGEK